MPTGKAAEGRRGSPGWQRIEEEAKARDEERWARIRRMGRVRYEPHGHRYSERLHRLRKAALLSILVRTAWTHSFDQSFQDDARQPRTIAQTIHYYAGMLASLPEGLRPEEAWAVAAPHPTSGRMHLHGFIRVASRHLRRGWWRACKEYTGGEFGWTRVHAFAATTMAELAPRLDYPAGHAIKESPTGFQSRMAFYAVTTVRTGYRVVRYAWCKSWWLATWKDGHLVARVREV